MANQLLNSVIEAMIAGNKQAQAGKDAGNRVAIEKEKLKQDKEYKDQLLKESQSRIDETTRRNQAEEDLKQQIAKEAHTRAGSELYTKAAKAVQEAPQGINPDTGNPHAFDALANFAKFHGGQVNQPLPQNPGGEAPDVKFGAPQIAAQGPIQGSVDFPEQGVTGVTPGGFPTQASDIQKAQDLNDIKSKAAKDILTQKLTAQHQNDLDRDKAKFDANYNLQGLRGVQNERRENIAGQYKQSVANINSNGHLNGIKLGLDLGMDNDSAAALSEHGRKLYHSILDGQENFKDLSKVDKLAVQHYATANDTEVPTDGKTYKQNLDALGTTQEIYNQYRDLAKKYSADQEGGGVIARNNKGFGPIAPSDLNSKLDGLKGQSANLVRSATGLNRLNIIEMAQATNGLFDPKATTKQNLDKIDESEKAQSPRVNALFTGIHPDEVNRVLGTRGIIMGADSRTGQVVPQSTPVRPSLIPQGPKPPRPGAVLNPAMSKAAGHNVWDLPVPSATQNPTAVTPQPQGLGAQ